MEQKQIKKKSYVGSIILILVGLYLFATFLTSTLDAINDYDDYKYSISKTKDEIEEWDKNPQIGETIPGKPKLDNPEPFNSFNTSGRFTNDGLDKCSLGFYNLTGIQLYFMEYEYGKTKFESESEIQADVKSKIETLDNVENSIVVYEYNTDYDYKDKYAYYSMELFYYGKNVANYLTANDLNIIEYYVNNAYDLWSYDERDTKMWATIGDKIINGYTVEPTVRSDLEFSIEYYEDECTAYRNVALVCGLLTAISGFLAIFGIITIIRNVRLNHKQIKADIELKEAIATKEILSADIDELVSKEDEDLINKYK